MSNRNMTVSVLVNLVDRMTGPLNRLRGGIDRLAEAGRRIGVIGAVAAGIGFIGPMQQAAAFDAGLRDIAITAGKSGAAVEAFIAKNGASYEKLALTVGQKSTDIMEASKLLFSRGMDASLIERNIGTIARVATAAGATMQDTAKTVFSLAQTLDISPQNMEIALAKLITAGKLGSFEFKNMAAEFPELTNQMAKLGVKGMEAVEFLGSALQTAMLGTSDPSAAANNLKNFLSKIGAPDAIKNFKKELNIDLSGLMAKASAKGQNPVEVVMDTMIAKLKPKKKEIDAIMSYVRKKGGNDKAQQDDARARVEQLLSGTRVGKLFADMQVLDFLIPAMLNRAKMKQFKEEIKAAGIDVIARDFQSRMNGLTQHLMWFGEVGTQVMRRIGLAFASNLPAANEALTSLLKWVADIDARFPGVIDKALSWAGAFILLGAGIAILTPVIGALLGPVGLLIMGLAAIGAGAKWVYDNWNWIWPALKEMASTAINSIVETLRGLGTRLQELGAAAIQGLWDGMKSRFEALVVWLTAQINRVRSLFISLGSTGNALGAGGAPQGGINVAPDGGAGSPSPNVPRPGSGGFSVNPGQQGSIGGSGGFAPRERAASNETKVGGRIVVSAAPGTTIREIQSDNAMIPITPDRGAMLSRA